MTARSVGGFPVNLGDIITSTRACGLFLLLVLTGSLPPGSPCDEELSSSCSLPHPHSPPGVRSLHLPPLALLNVGWWPGGSEYHECLGEGGQLRGPDRSGLGEGIPRQRADRRRWVDLASWLRSSATLYIHGTFLSSGCPFHCFLDFRCERALQTGAVYEFRARDWAQFGNWSLGSYPNLTCCISFFNVLWLLPFFSFCFRVILALKCGWLSSLNETWLIFHIWSVQCHCFANWRKWPRDYCPVGFHNSVSTKRAAVSVSNSLDRF